LLDGIDYKKLFEERRKTLETLSNEKDNVLDATIIEFDKDGRGEYAFLKVKNRKMLLFFPDFSAYGWNELDNKKQLHKLNGKKIKVFLDLFLIVEKDMRLSSLPLKKIQYKKVGAEYTINGKLQEKIPNIDNKFVVNCGIPIYITVPEKMKLKIGDWIQAEGRLDAYLAK